MDDSIDMKIDTSTLERTKTIGQSKFYDIEPGSPEKQDEMKSDEYFEDGKHFDSLSSFKMLILLVLSELTVLSDEQQEYTKFDAVTYLGAANIDAPKSEVEIQRNMQILAAHSSVPIKVSISVPSCSTGSVM